jgi:hypothetical protein
MNTQSLVTLIKEDFASDWSRTKILDTIDRGQKRLFSIDCPLTTFLNYSDVDFPLPIINTTAGTLKYDITAANLVNTAGGAVTLSIGGYTVTARKARNVFIKATTSVRNFDKFFYGEDFSWSGLNASWSKTWMGVQFQKVPIMPPHPKSGLENAFVQFVEDPGTHADTYYVEFYYNAPDLTSESIPLAIDAGRWADALIDYTVGHIENSQYGRSERLTKFENYWMKKFKSYGNAGMAERSPMKFQARECG